MAKNVKIDAAECVGCGLCEHMCPEVFSLANSDIAKVLSNADLNSEGIKTAAEECPVSAITVEG